MAFLDLHISLIILIILAGALGIVLLFKLIGTILTKILLRRRLNRWSRTPTDVIILHGFPPVKTLPNLSPFVLKLETYLRLANLPYKWDTQDYFGPKGKSPWISLNGKHIADSHFIIQYLGGTFEKDFGSKIPTEQLAIARIVRTMLEEYFTCAIGLERMVWGDLKKFKQTADIPAIFFYYMRRVLKNRFFEQGIGIHTQDEVTDIMTKNLKAVSIILRNKMYFGGDVMCEDDCGIFAVLAQCLWALPESPYENLINGDCSNLKDYCLRIKDKLWPDWDMCLAK